MFYMHVRVCTSASPLVDERQSKVQLQGAVPL